MYYSVYYRGPINLIKRLIYNGFLWMAGAPPSAPSVSSAHMPKTNSANGLAAASPRTVATDADGIGGAPVQTVRANPLKSDTGTDADGADGRSRASSVQHCVIGLKKQ